MGFPSFFEKIYHLGKRRFFSSESHILRYHQDYLQRIVKRISLKFSLLLTGSCREILSNFFYLNTHFMLLSTQKFVKARSSELKNNLTLKNKLIRKFLEAFF